MNILGISGTFLDAVLQTEGSNDCCSWFVLRIHSKQFSYVFISARVFRTLQILGISLNRPLPSNRRGNSPICLSNQQVDVAGWFIRHYDGPGPWGTAPSDQHADLGVRHWWQQQSRLGAFGGHSAKPWVDDSDGRLGSGQSPKDQVWAWPRSFLDVFLLCFSCTPATEDWFFESVIFDPRFASPTCWSRRVSSMWQAERISGQCGIVCAYLMMLLRVVWSWQMSP